MIRARFLRALREHAALRKGDGVLLAVSGGADSVCLLHLFLEARPEWSLHLAVAHFNHRLRGRSSAEDARFVERLARSRDLPFLKGAAGKKSSSPRGLSLQEAARNERLGFLLKTADETGCRKIALGHNADDQAETMVMRFLAGSGPAGLGGIRPASHDGRLIHPLLSLTRREIEDYLRHKSISFREDSSNLKSLYLRNRLRHELIPLMVRDYNPGLVSRLGDLSAMMRRDDDFLENMARPLLHHAKRPGGEFMFPAPLLRRAHPALLSRALLAALRSLCPDEDDFSSRHISALLEARRDSAFRRYTLPGGITASADGRGLTLRLSTPQGPRPSFHGALRVPGSVKLPGSAGKVLSSVRKKPRFFDPREVAGLPWRAVLDWDKVAPPLKVRSRMAGDRFRPLGLAGEKKLKKILIDGKIPRPLRDRLPVLCDSRGIIWVAGLRVSHRCRVTASTKKLLYLRADLNLDG